jgi:phosphoserine phosphatase SerB
VLIMVRTKQTARKSTGGKSICPRPSAGVDPLCDRFQENHIFYIEAYQLLLFPKSYVKGVSLATYQQIQDEVYAKIIGEHAFSVSPRLCKRHTIYPAICVSVEFSINNVSKADFNEAIKQWGDAFINELRKTIFNFSDLWNCILRREPQTAVELVVMDLDSTLIRQEVIDEMAIMTRSEEIAKEIKRITYDAMQGTMVSFEYSLKKRVELFRGYALDWNKLAERITPTTGADIFCATCKNRNISTMICSGGFLPIVKKTQEILNVDYGYANEIYVDSSGALTGALKEPIFGANSKKESLLRVASDLGIEIESEEHMASIMAVGDGANDIPMLTTPGIVGIAMNAKPVVQQKVPISIECDSMYCLCLFLDPCDY